MGTKVKSSGERAAAPIKKVISLLEKAYGKPSPKPYKNPLDELVFTILSQNTNDLNRDRAYASIRSRFPQWEQVMDAPEQEIAEAIKVGGLANQKSKRIKKILTHIDQSYGKLDLDFLKELPLHEAVELLGSFNGVGPKTVACVLLFACKRPVFPVDTHIFRIATRLGLLPPKCNDVKAHPIMGDLVPPEKVYSFHINMIEHGRRVCKPKRPQCSECVLKDICPASGKFEE